MWVALLLCGAAWILFLVRLFGAEPFFFTLYHDGEIKKYRMHATDHYFYTKIWLTFETETEIAGPIYVAWQISPVSRGQFIVLTRPKFESKFDLEHNFCYGLDVVPKNLIRAK